MNRRAFLGALLGAAASTACRSRAARARVGPARRVVSISPSTTEAMWALGATERLVGRSRYCNFPKEILALPQVGGYVDPNLEAILALEPDLVTGARGPIGTKLTDALEGRGVSVYFPRTESLAEVEQMMLGLGDRIAARPEADRAVAKLRAEVADVKSRSAGRATKRALLVFGVSPIVAAGPKSFADEMLPLAGAQNVVTEGESYPTLGFERVLKLDPDVIVNAAIAESHGAARIGKDDAVWSKARAVREGRVVVIEDESVLRPGPRLGQGLATLFHGIHGVS